MNRHVWTRNERAKGHVLQKHRIDLRCAVQLSRNWWLIAERKITNLFTRKYRLGPYTMYRNGPTRANRAIRTSIRMALFSHWNRHWRLGCNQMITFGTNQTLKQRKNVTKKCYFLTKMSIGAHSLAIETDRHRKPTPIPAEKRFCPICGGGDVEDEIHFLTNCSKFCIEREFDLGCTE